MPRAAITKITQFIAVSCNRCRRDCSNPLSTGRKRTAPWNIHV